MTTIILPPADRRERQQARLRWRRQIERRFTVLLATLLLFLLVGPPLAMAEHGILPIGVLMAAVVAVAAWAAARTEQTRRGMAALVILACALTTWNHLTRPTWVALLGTVIEAVIIGSAFLVILGHVLSRERVTADTVLGGICAYLMIGAFFYFAFSAVEILHRGSFLTSKGELLPDLAGEDAPLHRYIPLLYYSYVTLTTAGYGDIVPEWPLARSISCVEALLGQIYLATLIAFLVGLHVTHRSNGDPTHRHGGSDETAVAEPPHVAAP